MTGLALTSGPAGGVRPRPAPARSIGITPVATKVDFDLVLRLRTRALDRYLRGLFDPRSSLYGHYIEPATFGRRFGLSAAGLAALTRRLDAEGFQVVERFPQRTSLRVRGTAAAVRRTFGVTLRDYVDAGGGSYHAPDRAARVPRALAPWVDAVAGLDRRPVASTDVLPDGALRPTDVWSGYDVGPLYRPAAGPVDGKGQTIAVLSIDRFSQTHLRSFRAAFGLPSGPPVKTAVVSRSSDTSVQESDLDLEVIGSVAPRAQIIDYQLAYPDLARAINRVVGDGKARIVSGSFGQCDGTAFDQGTYHLGVDPGFRRDVESALLAAATRGVSFFFSTGDAGAYDCQRFDARDTHVTVHFPGDAPYSVAVGGTVLSLTSDGRYHGETGWADVGSNGGGGGGLNPFDRKPSWQGDLVPGTSNGGRQLPDVSAAAGSDSAWWVFDGRGSKGWESLAGTSAATPFWAASMLLVQEYLERQRAGPLCFAPPLLYAIARTSWKFPPFHDVTLGGNRYYAARRGWDFATGWGSPDVWNLATAAAVYRGKHPLPGGNACSSQIR